MIHKIINIKNIFLALLILPTIIMATQTYKSISYKETKRIYDAHSGLFIDAREIKFYKKGTILGAINMPIRHFRRMKRLLPVKKSSKIVLFCNGAECNKSTELANKISQLGYKRLMVFTDGYPKWKAMKQDIMLSDKYLRALKKIKNTTTIQGVQIELGKDEGSIDASWLSEKIATKTLPKNILLVDVRNDKFFQAGHIKNSIHIPWDGDKGVIRNDKFPDNKLIILYCNTGMLSSDAYDSLDEESSKNVLFLDASVKCKKGKCTIKANN